MGNPKPHDPMEDLIAIRLTRRQVLNLRNYAAHNGNMASTIKAIDQQIEDAADLMNDRPALIEKLTEMANGRWQGEYGKMSQDEFEQNVVEAMIDYIGDDPDLKFLIPSLFVW